MITIANLAAAKDLDHADMSAVTGGNSLFSNSATNGNFQGGLSFASPQVNVAPVTQVDASQHTTVDLTNVTKSIASVGSMLGVVKI
jgi:hypothetical protein